MTKIPSYSEPDALATAVGELVQLSLTDGVDPADLSAALTVAAVRIGLQFAPNAGVAFAVVMKAASNVAVELVTTVRPGADESDDPTVPLGTTMH
jgi:hypothetical protein